MRVQRESEVIYQICPRTFCDSNGDGHGDINGITSRIQYFVDLGVNTLWLGPIHPSPSGPKGDWGYAVTKYSAIDPVFGDLDDFKHFLKAAHDKKLRVYMDFVLAHTADNHEWFEKSRKRIEPYTDYYVWHDGKIGENGERLPPNNWKSAMGGSAWTFDEVRGQWYLHNFLDSQPALNLNASHVQDAILKEMKFWLDLGVDGFRLDAQPFCNYDPLFRDNPLMDNPDPKHIGTYREQLLIHSMNHDATRDFNMRIRGLLDSYPNRRIALGEVLAGLDGGRNSIPVAASFVENGDIDMCYTGELLNIQGYPHGGESLKEILLNIQKHFPNGGHCYALSNHDKVRAATRMTRGLKDPKNYTAAVHQALHFLLSMPGVICLLQGEELGLPQARIPEDIGYHQVRDPLAFLKNAAKPSRDGSRTPPPFFKDERHAGFSTAQDIHLPVAVSHYPLAVDVQENMEGSTLNIARRLIHSRKDQPAIMKGHLVMLDAPKPVLAFLCQSKEQTLLRVFNWSEAPVTLDLRTILDARTRQLIGINNPVLHLEACDVRFIGDIKRVPQPRPERVVHDVHALVHA